jgi:phospholipid/cholesterol/gamma-HCH transport system permease protein
MAGASFILKEGRVLALLGDWTVWTVADVDAPLRALAAEHGPGLTVDVSSLGQLDVAGAYVIDRTVRGGSPCGNMETPLRLVGAHAAVERLVGAARGAVQPCPTTPPQPMSITVVAERVGRALEVFWRETLETLSFLGRCIAVLFRVLINPSRLRLTSVFAQMEVAGFNALPIISVLSFFVGLVVAYLGASVLKEFGADVFTVELVGFSVLREFAVVITAVLLAGRTDSAFTAEIGAMKMRQEIDAMRVLGLDVMERLVAPRLIAMVIMTPILTFAAMIAGLFGGMLVCWLDLGVSPLMFLNRMQDSVGDTPFWVGMVKAPVFGFILAVVGCRHGLRVGGDVASLGRETTASVVQAIFLVLVVDSVFALWFRAMNL